MWYAINITVDVPAITTSTKFIVDDVSNTVKDIFTLYWYLCYMQLVVIVKMEPAIILQLALFHLETPCDDGNYHKTPYKPTNDYDLYSKINGNRRARK